MSNTPKNGTNARKPSTSSTKKSATSKKMSAKQKKQIYSAICAIALILVVVLVLCLAQCSSNKKASDEQKDAQTATQSTKTNASASSAGASKSAKKVSLTNDNITVKGKTYAKTNFDTVIAGTKALSTSKQASTTVTVTNKDNNWKHYLPSNESDLDKGVFVKGRTVQLYAFAIGKYEVTQELYQAVMGENPSYFTKEHTLPEGEKISQRAVDSVSWFEACLFCNKLTALVLSEKDVVYYADEAFTTIYDGGEKIFMNPDKKGYRLPTEAEWEYAARGGKPDSERWNYAFAGVDITKDVMLIKDGVYLEKDEKLETVAWYKANSNMSVKEKVNYGTHQVGKKKANNLGLFDMSGNVQEWCWDWYNNNATIDDSLYTTKNGIVLNPLGAKTGTMRVSRGGSWYALPYYSSVAVRGSNIPSNKDRDQGFRICRTLFAE